MALRFGAKSRIYLFSTFLVQALLVLVVAILVLTGVLNILPPESSLQFLIIFPLGIVFGTQAAVSRPFGIPAITTGKLAM